MITGYDRKNNKKNKKTSRIIFWEKNGLRHLEFHLPNLSDPYDKESSDLLVKKIYWNKDGEILSLTILDHHGN